MINSITELWGVACPIW